jgi:hypothetical protein
MIYFSRVLPYKINRPLNIGAAILTSIYVVGGGSLMPHYLICAGIEVVVLFVIIWNVYKWPSKEESRSCL